MAVQTRIQMRRGELTGASGWVALNPTLSAGEWGLDTTTKRYKIGDGLTPWNSLAYSSILPSNTDLIGASGIGLSFSSVTGVPITISVTGIQSSQVNDFASAVNTLINSETIQDIIGVSVTGVSGIAVSYNDTTGYTTISLSDPTIQVSDITNFASGVNSLIDSAVSTSIVGGSGIDIVYNSGNNTLTVSSPLTAGSGISLSHSSGNYVVSLSDPTIQVSDITDLTSSASELNLLDGSAPETIVANRAVIYGDVGEVRASGLYIGNLGATGINATGLLRVNAVDVGDGVFSVSSLGEVYAAQTINTNNLIVRNNASISGNLTLVGSGLVASNINNFDSQVRTSRLDQMAAPTGSVSLNSQKITNLATPTDDSDAATKAYVDASRAGLDVKQSVRVATTSADSSLSVSGLQTIDGVTLVAGDRVLVKDHAEPRINGIWVAASGSWSRAADANSSEEVTAGMFVFVTEGTVNADSGWVLTTNDPITINGTVGTALNFAQFSGAGQITAGDGMVKSGNTLNVGTASSSRIVVNADNIDLATVSRTDSGSGNVVVGVTTDSYGRVTSIASGLIPDASTTVKGIASFDSGDFNVTSGAVSIKASGVGNSQLENSRVTIGSTVINLGDTAVSVSGLTSVSSTTFVGALTGNASTATTLQTARTINGTSFNGSADIIIQFVDGGTP
jgi:hypothetical protein